MRALVTVAIFCGSVSAFSGTFCDKPICRRGFANLFISSVAGVSLVANAPEPCGARGRATLDQSYDRYTPRIVAGGSFYSDEFKRMVGSADWKGLKQATSEPPPKSKEDRSKMDGGTSARAAKAGQFSDARVLVAADLFASAFSDSKISAKTKRMQAEVATMRESIQGINLAAREALGEEISGGGFLGF
eukprot:CAMPEP_0194029710 /NCGR_PEP_ID=MMETSP0009_2-20130614/3374_1 /TAXON_ID=210454 /ORGANISM="Grammatophora oceanica, Strain CCMP 410" /LENGTH=188 /DNA_ID=CAMNT_0038669461 /DNA_START=8 /DNA_END=571 /DNA_ORIENTATION=+